MEFPRIIFSDDIIEIFITLTMIMVVILNWSLKLRPDSDLYILMNVKTEKFKNFNNRLEAMKFCTNPKYNDCNLAVLGSVC